MREILFKAKRIDNGEWVERFYWASLDPTSEETRWRGHFIHNGVNIAEPIRVDPETVCQYTGLKDARGVRIWEGDRLYDGSMDYVIRYEAGSFFAIYDDNSATLLYDIITDNYACVIGNIHDETETT